MLIIALPGPPKNAKNAQKFDYPVLSGHFHKCYSAKGLRVSRWCPDAYLHPDTSIYDL
jgi:hypothetical protein